MRLPAGYLVLLRHRGHPADTTGPRPGRDTVRDALRALPGLLRGPAPSGTGTLFLLPADDPDPAATRQAARELFTARALLRPGRLRIAEAHAATPEAVPAAVRETERLVPLVAALPDAGDRPYRSDELLVELAVTQHPFVRRRLTEILAPLALGTDLRRTLEVLFDAGLDRERATRALFIHRRTLSYRIRRIRELTGLDPTTPHGIQLPRTALTVSRLDAPGPPGGGVSTACDTPAHSARRVSGGRVARRCRRVTRTARLSTGMSITYEPFRFQDILTGRLLEYYGERWPPVVGAGVQTLLAVTRYLDWRDFGRLLEGATEALSEPDRFRLRADWFSARLEQGVYGRMEGAYTPVTRLAVRTLATVEAALGDEFRVFLRLVAEAHRTCAPASVPTG